MRPVSVQTQPKSDAPLEANRKKIPTTQVKSAGRSEREKEGGRAFSNDVVVGRERARTKNEPKKTTERTRTEWRSPLILEGKKKKRYGEVEGDA